MTASSDRFPTATEGLAEAHPPETVELADGERLQFRIAPVAKRLGHTTVRMLAYNGSIPGPVLRVKEGTEVVVYAINEIDLETTVHWHGLRLDNRYDGTATVQEPMPVGGSFSYRLAFPDPGIYWYHPHIREDYEQEMGLYGTIIVEPRSPTTGPRSTGSSLSPSTTCCWRTGRSRRSAGPRPATSRWDASATCCWPTATRISRSPRAAARCCAST